MIGVDARGRGWGLGFALLGAAVAWTGHLLAAWGVSEFGCTAGAPRGAIVAALAVISVVSLAVAVASTVYAAMLERRVDRAEPTRPLARIGWLAGVVFVITIGAQTVPIVWFSGRC